MKIMFTAIGAYGHLYPLLPLATACASAGHDVLVATGDPFLGNLALPTVRGYPEMSVGDTVEETKRRHPDAEGQQLAMYMFGEVAAERVAPTVIGLGMSERPDLVVYDAMTTGAAVAAQVLGIPAVAFGIGLIRFHYPGLHGITAAALHDQWSAVGRTAPTGDGLLADAFLDPVPPSLHAAGGEVDVPTIPIRTVPYSEDSAEVPGWLLADRSRPAAYLTLGTVSFGAVEVLRRAIDDLAGLDLDVLVAIGPAGDPTLLGDLPGNVHLEHFVAQARVLSLVDVAVHHGGTGTVLGALAAGVPQLLLPQGADQFFNAELITTSGAGRALPNDAQRPGTIAEAVLAMLSATSPEREAATMIAAEIATMPAPEMVVADLVRLVERS